MQSHRVRMRSLGDVSARPAKGLRHPERGEFWESILGRFWETAQGGAKKGLKRARSYIYIATRTFWGSFWGLGRLM